MDLNRALILGSSIEMELAVAHYKKVLLEAIGLRLEVAVWGLFKLVLELQLLSCVLAGKIDTKRTSIIQILIQLLLLREFTLLFFVTERGTKLGGLANYLLT